MNRSTSPTSAFLGSYVGIVQCRRVETQNQHYYPPGRSPFFGYEKPFLDERHEFLAQTSFDNGAKWVTETNMIDRLTYRFLTSGKSPAYEHPEISKPMISE